MTMNDDDWWLHYHAVSNEVYRAMGDIIHLTRDIIAQDGRIAGGIEHGRKIKEALDRYDDAVMREFVPGDVNEELIWP